MQDFSISVPELQELLNDNRPVFLLDVRPQDPVVLPAHVSRAVPFDGKVIQARLSALREKLELLILSKTEFIAATLTRIPPTPPNYLTIAGLNKSGSYAGHVPAELEAGANRCAVA
jgi:hypothetical protein